MNEKIFELIFIKIQLHNENLFCGNIYRSPSNDIRLNENFLNNLYNCIHNSNESLTNVLSMETLIMIYQIKIMNMYAILLK